MSRSRKRREPFQVVIDLEVARDVDVAALHRGDVRSHRYVGRQYLGTQHVVEQHVGQQLRIAKQLFLGQVQLGQQFSKRRVGRGKDGEGSGVGIGQRLGQTVVADEAQQR